MDEATARVGLPNHLCCVYMEEDRWMQQHKVMSTLSSQSSSAVPSAGGWPEMEYPDVPSLLLHEVHYQMSYNGDL